MGLFDFRLGGLFDELAAVEDGHDQGAVTDEEYEGRRGFLDLLDDNDGREEV